MESIQETLSRLKFISKIPREEKINVTRLVTQSTGWMTSFMRTILEPDNRANALDFINKTFKRTFELVTANLPSKNVADRALCADIVADLLECLKHGLVNLKTTYVADLMFCCKLDALIATTAARLNAIYENDRTVFPAGYQPRITEVANPDATDDDRTGTRKMSSKYAEI